MPVLAAGLQLWESPAVSFTVQQARFVLRSAVAAAAAAVWLALSGACSGERVVQTVKLREGTDELGNMPECTGDACQETASESTHGPGHDASSAGGAQPSAVETAGSGAKATAGSEAGVAGTKTPPPTAAGAGTGAPVSSGPQNEAKPGDSGLGDPDYTDYGNSGYDVSHYDIRLRYTPSEDRLAGTTTLTLTPDMYLFALQP